MHLRQSTASQAVLIGPFVDDADGNTVESGLSIANTDIRLSKNGANIAAKNSGGGTHDELGYYTITLDATDTDTVGRLQLMAHVAGALPVYHEYEVLEEAAYDAIYAAAAAPATAAALATVDGNVDSILADTNEVQGDLADGGRLDLLVDAIKAKTDNLPSDPADASVVAGRFDTLDTAIADLPTNSELATALTGPLAANVKQVNDIDVGGAGTEGDPWSPAA